MPYNNMKRVVVGCQHCIGRNDDEKEVLQEMYNANPYVVLLEPFKGRTKRIKMLCTKHNIVSNKTPYEVIAGKGCVQCGIEKLSEQSKLPESVFITRLNMLFPYIRLVDGYDGVRSSATFHCDRCGSNFVYCADYISRRGCPVCDASSMEKKIRDILNIYNIKYQPQYSFKDCKDKKALPFDFYLTEYNILIEYDGQQHYYPVNFGGISDEKAYENFKITQLHDAIKTNYCKCNNITLIRIPYWESNNIEKIILDNIKCVITEQND